jgi:alkylhydroperoxidase family enzyme
LRVTPARLSEDDPDPVLRAVVARRGGKLTELDRALLVSLPFADGWNTFIGKVRTDLKIPALYRELAMCGVAVVNRASYEFEQHGPLYIQAGGTPAKLAAIQTIMKGVPAIFSPAEKAVLQLTLEMSRDVEVGDKTFAAAKAALADERELVELVGVIAAYNMVSRFLVALKV